MDFAGGSDGKVSAYNVGETQVQTLGQEDPLEKGMATHSSIFAWKISWTEEPGRLQSMGLQRVRHDCDFTLFFLSFFYACILVLLKSYLPTIAL